MNIDTDLIIAAITFLIGIIIAIIKNTPIIINFLKKIFSKKSSEVNQSIIINNKFDDDKLIDNDKAIEEFVNFYKESCKQIDDLRNSIIDYQMNAYHRWAKNKENIILKKIKKKHSKDVKKLIFFNKTLCYKIYAAYKERCDKNSFNTVNDKDFLNNTIPEIKGSIKNVIQSYIILNDNIIDADIYLNILDESFTDLLISARRYELDCYNKIDAIYDKQNEYLRKNFSTNLTINK